MVLYEVVILVKSSLSKKEVDTVLAMCKDAVKKHKGKVVKEEDWGIMDLAYPIQKNSKAKYLFLCLDVSHLAVEEMSKEMGIREDTLRHLVVKVDQISSEPSPIMRRIENV